MDDFLFGADNHQIAIICTMNHGLCYTLGLTAARPANNQITVVTARCTGIR
jgi:hypothetical protein